MACVGQLDFLTYCDFLNFTIYQWNWIRRNQSSSVAFPLSHSSFQFLDVNISELLTSPSLQTLVHRSPLLCSCSILTQGPWHLPLGPQPASSLSSGQLSLLSSPSLLWSLNDRDKVLRQRKRLYSESRHWTARRWQNNVSK